MTRESRQAMIEQYVTTRDGYLAARVLMVDKHPSLPSYAEDEAPPKTGEDLFRDFAHLVTPRVN